MSELTMETKYSIELSNSKQNFILSEDLRTKAAHVLATTDFPTTRTEAWKYTRVAKIKNGNFKVSDKIDLGSININDYLIPNLEGSVVVFVNGFYSEELSSLQEESGLELVSLGNSSNFNAELGKDVALDDEVFNAINTYYAQDGVGIRIAKKTNLNQSIQVVFISTEDAVFSGLRNAIICEDFASAHLVFNYVSFNATSNFVNAISEIKVGSNAQLTIDKIQNEADSTYSIITELVDQAKDSNFTINTITLDGGLVRNNLKIEVSGENCETNLNGVYILKGQQHVDNHTTVDHKVAHCNSNEAYKGVIYDKATAVFNGKVFVRKDAQKTNAFQQNANVLMSLDASVNSKPELEIYADDVKCSHGSTTGQLDEEAIFYLRARGISERMAKQLVVNAFVVDVVNKILNTQVKDFVFQHIEKDFN